MTMLARIVIIFLYIDDIVLLARFTSILNKKLRFLKDFYSAMDMIINIDKTKVMIIKSDEVIYAHFLFDNNILEEVLACSLSRDS